MGPTYPASSTESSHQDLVPEEPIERNKDDSELSITTIKANSITPLREPDGGLDSVVRVAAGNRNRTRPSMVPRRDMIGGRAAMPMHIRRNQEPMFTHRSPSYGRRYAELSDFADSSHLYYGGEPVRCAWPGCGQGFLTQREYIWHEVVHTGHHWQPIARRRGRIYSESPLAYYGANYFSPPPIYGINTYDGFPRQSYGNITYRLSLPPEQYPCFAYEQLAKAILSSMSEADQSVSEPRRQVRKLRQKMVSLNPVESLLYSNEYRCELLKLSSCTPIDEHTLHLVLHKDQDIISAMFSMAIHSEPDRRAILSLRGDKARQMLDLIEALLNKPALGSRDLIPRLEAARFLVELSEASHELPSSITIQGVKLHDQRSLFGGDFAEIFRGLYCGSDVAVKRLLVFESIEDQEKMHREFRREALAWHRLKHPYVLPFLGIDSDTFSPSVCMISPWMANGTISRQLLLQDNRIDVTQAIFEIAQGLEYIHDKNLVHGNLRGGNILLDEGFHVRLADFGLTAFRDVVVTTHTDEGDGHIRWIAPEVYHPESSGKEGFQPTCASDIYAFACVCVEIHTGHSPFWYISEDTTVISKVMQGERPQRPSTMSDSTWNLVERCWAQQGRARPSMPEIVRIVKGWTVA